MWHPPALHRWCYLIVAKSQRKREINEIFTPYCDYIAIIARWCARSAMCDLQYLCAKRHTHTSLAFHLKHKKNQSKTWYFYLFGVSIVRILKATYNHLRRGIVCDDAAAAIIQPHTPKTITVNLRIFHSRKQTHPHIPVRHSSSNSHWLRQLWFGLTQSQVDRHTRPKIEFNFPMFAILFSLTFFSTHLLYLNCILIYVVVVVDPLSTASICILSANHA